MSAEDNQALVDPLVKKISNKGYKIKVPQGIPNVFVTLPKSVILEIAEDSTVSEIFLADQKETSQMGTSASSSRAVPSWYSANSGLGIGVAILELGIIDFTSFSAGPYLNKGEVRPCQSSYTGDGHKTKVASIVGSSYARLPGIAKDAIIYDACSDGSVPDTIAALDWIVPRVDIVNISYSLDEFFPKTLIRTPTGEGMEYADKAFDHYVRNYFLTITVAAGNYGSYIISPGYAWNVITVGGTDDRQTAGWSNDIMYSQSSYLQHPTAKVEKPEIVAPAVIEVYLGDSYHNVSSEGTSFAAPQAAGAAAIMSKSGSIGAHPVAIKAAMMASAVLNLDSSTIPLYTAGNGSGIIEDYKDGAGAINIALAEKIARNYAVGTCIRSCWTTASIPASSTESPPNQFFYAAKGERVRVAIAWYSNVSCLAQANCSDALSTNLNLYIYAPDQTIPFQSSTSIYNNYEIVEFIAPETGQYMLEPRKASGNETGNTVGIAVAKDAIFLPDLRNGNNWKSTIIIRNENPLGRSISINYFSSGFHRYTENLFLAPNESRSISLNDTRLPESNGIGVVEAGEGITTQVLQTDPASAHRLNSDNGIMTFGSGDPAFEQQGIRVRPEKRSIFGRQPPYTRF